MYENVIDANLIAMVPIKIIIKLMIEATAINGVGASFNCDQVIVEIVSFVGPAINNATNVSLIEIANPQIPDITIAGNNKGKVINHKVSKIPAPSPIAAFSISGFIYSTLFFRIKYMIGKIKQLWIRTTSNVVPFRRIA